MEMGKIALFLLLWSLFQFSGWIQSHDRQSWGTTQVTNWQEKQELGPEKMTQLHFYFHDTISGKQSSAVRVTQVLDTANLPTLFGAVLMVDDPLTERPEATSKFVGRAQGVYGSEGQQELGLILAMMFGFVDEKYNASTLRILGRNPALHPVHEMHIVGGTGGGIATVKTYWLDMKTVDAIVEYNVIAIHY